MGDRLLAVLIAAAFMVIAVASCLMYLPHHAGRATDYEPLAVHDRQLLTPEQQRLLVRYGSLTVEINGKEYTFHNDESMRPYLNEGGLEQ